MNNGASPGKKTDDFIETGADRNLPIAHSLKGNGLTDSTAAGVVGKRDTCNGRGSQYRFLLGKKNSKIRQRSTMILGNTSKKKNISIRATLPTLSAVATIGETFSLSKKRAQKNSGKGKPPPPIRAMPELKRFFCFALVP